MLDRFNTPWSRNISILFTTTNIQNSDQKFALFSFRKYLQKNDTKKTFSFLGKFSFTHFSFEEKMWTVYNRHLTSEYNLQRNMYICYYYYYCYIIRRQVKPTNGITYITVHYIHYCTLHTLLYIYANQQT